MTDRYEGIRKALAMGPTPGPYEIYQDGGRFYVETTTRQSRCGVFKVLGSPESERLANAKLAAACDPDTIQALLDECDALRGEVAEWKSVAVAQSTEIERLREALEDIRSRSSIDLAMNPNPFTLTAMLGNIHQIADAALSKENKA